jgi:hypothetical protein
LSERADITRRSRIWIFIDSSMDGLGKTKGPPWDGPFGLAADLSTASGTSI